MEGQLRCQFCDEGPKVCQQGALGQQRLWRQRRIDGFGRHPDGAILVGDSRRVIPPAPHAANDEREVSAEPVIGSDPWSCDHNGSSALGDINVA